MTREEAIREWIFRSKHMKRWLYEYGKAAALRHYVELVDMAIEALQREEAEEKGYCHRIKPKQDLISRSDAIEAVCDKCPFSFKEKCEWKDNGHCSTKVTLEALPSAEDDDRLYIKIYADDEPSVKAEKLYQICGETQNREVTEWLKEYFPSARTDLISRTKLFNKLATVQAPPEANEYKAEVYKTIQSMGTEEEK